MRMIIFFLRAIDILFLASVKPQRLIYFVVDVLGVSD